MVTVTFTMRRHLIGLASAPFISSHLATFGWVRFLGATCGKHNAEFTKGGWELGSYCRPFVDQSSRKFLQTTQQMRQFFGPQFLWEGRLQLFNGSLLGRLTTHYLAKFGWDPFAVLRLQSLAMKQNAEFTEDVQKCRLSVKPFVDQN